MCVSTVSPYTMNSLSLTLLLQVNNAKMLLCLQPSSIWHLIPTFKARLMIQKLQEEMLFDFFGEPKKKYSFLSSLIMVRHVFQSIVQRQQFSFYGQLLGKFCQSPFLARFSKFLRSIYIHPATIAYFEFNLCCDVDVHCDNISRKFV